MQRRLATQGLMASALAAASSGCALLWEPIRVKLDLQFDLEACNTRADTLLVLLPGAHMSLDEMRSEGLVAAVRQRKLAVDVMLADSHLGYIYNGSLFERLRDDVLLPARALGWRQVWLAGISFGAYAALGSALRHPDLVDGVFALAPYLGRQALVQEMAAARRRGLSQQQWLAASRPQGAYDNDHALWSWLLRPPSAAAGVPVHLAYGLQDRFAVEHQLLAGVLPPERVLTSPGGHDWAPWRSLWGQWLDRAPWPRQCAV